MNDIETTALKAPNSVGDHSGRWVLFSSIAFVLLAGGILLGLRWLGLK
jgi:hypothetical protein